MWPARTAPHEGHVHHREGLHRDQFWRGELRPRRVMRYGRRPSPSLPPSVLTLATGIAESSRGSLPIAPLGLPLGPPPRQRRAVGSTVDVAPVAPRTDHDLTVAQPAAEVARTELLRQENPVEKEFSHRPGQAILWRRHKRWSAKIPVGLQTSLGVFARFSFEEPIGYIEPPLPGHSTRPTPKEKKGNETDSRKPIFPNDSSKPRTHRQNHAVSGSH